MSLISTTFKDFDEFALSVDGVDAQMMLQNPSHHSWHINKVNLGGVCLQSGQLGSGNIAEGQSWPDKTMIYLPLSSSSEYLANGQTAGQKDLIIMEPGCEFCLSTKSAHNWFAILVETNKLACADDLEKPVLGISPSNSTNCFVKRNFYRRKRHLYSIVKQILEASAYSIMFSDLPAAEAATKELIEVANQALETSATGRLSPRRKGRPTVPRRDIVDACKELMEKRSNHTIRIAEMACAAGVSQRTLRQAFYDYFGVGPVCYLQLRQLHQVHRALRLADPKYTHVSDVFIRLGVWQFGRFASRYREVFGELPSQTLRKPAR